MNEYEIKRMIQEERENHSNGCLSVIFGVVFMAFSIPPLSVLCAGYWNKVLCDYKWGSVACDKPHVKFWDDYMNNPKKKD